VRISKTPFSVTFLCTLCITISSANAEENDPKKALPGTDLLTIEGDVASHFVAGVDRFLLREIDASVAKRASFWNRDLSSAEAYEKSVAKNRARLAHILGVRDARPSSSELQFVSPSASGGVIAETPTYEVRAVRWRAFGRVHGEGLMISPRGDRAARGDIVAIPDAGQTPEMLCGLVEGIPEAQQFARMLANRGFRVLVPTLIDRTIVRSTLTNREFLYRSAFELGRHIIGYEVQKVLAGVDYFVENRKPGASHSKIGVIGYGEGGLLALYAGAIDTRIDSVCTSGFFGPREAVWKEPIERNVFGLLEQFGDAEVATLVYPRNLVVEMSTLPAVSYAPGKRGGPGALTTPSRETVEAEWKRAQDFVKGSKVEWPAKLVFGDFGSSAALVAFVGRVDWVDAPLKVVGKLVDAKARHKRQLEELDAHNQRLLADSPYVRREFMKKLDTSSVEKYEASVEWYRKFFYDEVIGRFERPLLPPKPKTRQTYSGEGWTGYEVVLDVFPDVIAYGILLVPAGIKNGERRPVVVCQHGLEGRPQDVIGKPSYHYYKAFAAKLAQRGFVTFAPQNLYIFRDRFRTLQRKANPIKKSLFSVIVPQHQQIVDWMQTLPFVDPERIGFYGLSYGGKTAMRVPPLVKDYKFSICSADFNEWVWKNASTRARYSYVWTGEYEIFEFDLGSTFNYAEMAALIAPRPFMVERGHFDGVAPDETVGYEFAKVRNLYAARLKIPERCEIEWFDGPHTINAKATFDFCHRHLDWPVPKK